MYVGVQVINLFFCLSAGLTINVPPIWKVREIIFSLAGKTHNVTVRGIFRGGRDLFDP
jgi:hypothetical protein